MRIADAYGPSLPPAHLALDDFWEYAGDDARAKIVYREVATADLNMVEDDTIDYFFSFGAFCHIRPELQDEYLRNAFAKARSGAMGVVMYANFDKSNAALDHLGHLRTVPMSLRGARDSLRYNYGMMMSRFTGRSRQDKTDTTDRPGRFFHREIDEVARVLTGAGWDIIAPDVGLNHRDPIVWFHKP